MEDSFEVCVEPGKFSNLAQGKGVGGVLHDFCDLSMLVCEGVLCRNKAIAGQQSADSTAWARGAFRQSLGARLPGAQSGSNP
jgi:hypothetical protein